MHGVIEHLNANHDRNLSAVLLQFDTKACFDAWLHSTEVDTVCSFLKQRQNVQLHGIVSYYYCSRSGSRRPTVAPNERKRHLKVQGSVKINRTCPVHFIKTANPNGRVQVKYYSKHLCYTNVYDHLGHTRLSANDRQWIAGKLALQIPIEVILRQMRNTLDGQLKRSHILTKKDIGNIERAFHLNRPERQHCDDATSVHAFVQLYQGQDNNPIIGYNARVPNISTSFRTM
jgi:hypothetical protein